jgi:hypothetical protein
MCRLKKDSVQPCSERQETLEQRDKRYRKLGLLEIPRPVVRPSLELTCPPALPNRMARAKFSTWVEQTPPQINAGPTLAEAMINIGIHQYKDAFHLILRRLTALKSKKHAKKAVSYRISVGCIEYGTR